MSGTYSTSLAALAHDLPVGLMAQPRTGLEPRLASFRWWAADNGCFSQGEKFNLDRFHDWLAAVAPWNGTCLFATAPDVLGDAAATLERSVPVLGDLRRAGYKAALVAQDGLEGLTVPWGLFDCLFIGGTTEWKLSGAVADLTTEARSRAKWVHLGRVNSEKRLNYARWLGAHSCDGNFLRVAPDGNVHRLRRWFQQHHLCWGEP